MAAIASVNGAQLGAFAASPTVLTADDTITYNQGRKQLLLLRNSTAGALTATIDGSEATSVAVAGLGSVSVAAGLAVAVPANSTRAVVLGTVSAYCKGVVHLLGGAGLEATLIDL